MGARVMHAIALSNHHLASQPKIVSSQSFGNSQSPPGRLQLICCFLVGSHIRNLKYSENRPASKAMLPHGKTLPHRTVCSHT